MNPPEFLIDERLSPVLAHRLVARGYDATSVRDRGRLSKKDTPILAYCIEDRILVTQNVEDFRKLVAKAELHPGLVLRLAERRSPCRYVIQAVPILTRRRERSLDVAEATAQDVSSPSPRSRNELGDVGTQRFGIVREIERARELASSPDHDLADPWRIDRAVRRPSKSESPVPHIGEAETP